MLIGFAAAGIKCQIRATSAKAWVAEGGRDPVRSEDNERTRTAGVTRRGLAALVAILALIGPAHLAAAEDGVSADRILFGQSAALTGPAAALGLEMQRGIEAAFAEANAAGGVGGRQIELVTRDDRYEPEAAIANTGALIHEDRVFALI